MDYSHLDLSRFRKMTREEYYTTDWKITPEEVEFAEEFDQLTPYERHNRCHEYTRLVEFSKASEAWNIWACYVRESYIEEWDGKEGKELYGKNKQKNEFNLHNRAINFQEGLIKDTDDYYIADYLDFENFIFPGGVSIEKIHIAKHASLLNTIFLQDVSFDNSKIDLNLRCDDTVFEGFATFEDTIFDGAAIFLTVTFREETSFDGATFNGFANFTCVVFLKFAYFRSCKFNSYVLFRNSLFKSFTFFDDACSKVNINFEGTHILQYISFEGAKFYGIAAFDNSNFGKCSKYEVPDRLSQIPSTEKQIQYIESEIEQFKSKNIDFVPDFITTYFETPPNLSYTKFQKQSHEAIWRRVFPIPKAASSQLVALKYRRLKELAEGSKNHTLELEFFRQEMLARRGYEVKGIQSGMINIYEYFSKCGLSAKRPLLALIGFFFIFWGLYYAMYADMALDHIYSINWQDLMTYSAHNALPLIGANESQKLELVTKLFGTYDARPLRFGILSFVQNLIGLTLYFLVLLAIRNYFRMK